jgi:glycosyltransferase involved in cell wall biosynthesis
MPTTDGRRTVTLMVPTLNEIDGLKSIMPLVKPEWVDQILIVDGNSSDGSADYARSQGWDVVVQSRPGIRFAYFEAWPHIRGDIVVTFSPDGNSIPELIPQLIAKIRDESWDMVIASRYAPGAKSDDDDWLTGFGNWLFTRVINLLHGGHYTDAMVIYRAYPKQLFYDLDLDKDDAYTPEKLFFTIMGVEPLLSVRAAKRKLRLTDIPGSEPARVGGVRKLQTFRWGGAYMTQVFRELYYWK